MAHGYRLIYSWPLLSPLNLYLLIFASEDVRRLPLSAPESIGFAVNLYLALPWRWADWNADLFLPDVTNLDKLFFSPVSFVCVCACCGPNVRRVNILSQCCCLCSCCCCFVFFFLSRDRLSIFPRVHLLCCYFFPLCVLLSWASKPGTCSQKRCLKTGCYQTQSHQRLSTFSK